ncbi:hypothetical protein HYS30_03345, partial [Candidatus Peregrinibacteria bacterium]|nr:hypothetical protein [Candidatus Peregrinibacteria bacterium]
MTDIRVPNHASQDWVETIERDRGYSALEMHAFGALLDRMPSYAFFRALLRHLQPGETALEAGCGYALSSFALSKRGVNVTAIDISTKLIADLRRIQGAMERSSMQHLLLPAWD